MTLKFGKKDYMKKQTWPDENSEWNFHCLKNYWRWISTYWHIKKLSKLPKIVRESSRIWATIGKNLYLRSRLWWLISHLRNILGPFKIFARLETLLEIINIWQKVERLVATFCVSQKSHFLKLCALCRQTSNEDTQKSISVFQSDGSLQALHNWTSVSLNVFNQHRQLPTTVNLAFSSLLYLKDRRVFAVMEAAKILFMNSFFLFLLCRETTN